MKVLQFLKKALEWRQWIIIEVLIVTGAIIISILNRQKWLWVGILFYFFAHIHGRQNGHSLQLQSKFDRSETRKLIFPLVLILATLAVGFWRFDAYPPLHRACAWEKGAWQDFDRLMANGFYDRLKYTPIGEGLTHSAPISYFYSKYLIVVWKWMHHTYSTMVILRLANMFLTAWAPLLSYLLFLPFFGRFTAFIGSFFMIFLPVFVYHLHGAFFPGASLTLSLLISLIGTKIFLNAKLKTAYFFTLPPLLIIGAHFYTMLRLVTMALIFILPFYALNSAFKNKTYIFSSILIICYILSTIYLFKYPDLMKKYLHNRGENIQGTITPKNPNEFKRYLRLGGFDPEMDLNHWKTKLLGAYSMVSINVETFFCSYMNVKSMPLLNCEGMAFPVPYFLPSGVFGLFAIGLGAFAGYPNGNRWYWRWFILFFLMPIVAILSSWSTTSHRLLFLLPQTAILTALGLRIILGKILPQLQDNSSVRSLEVDGK